MYLTTIFMTGFYNREVNIPKRNLQRFFRFAKNVGNGSLLARKALIAFLGNLRENACHHLKAFVKKPC